MTILATRSEGLATHPEGRPRAARDAVTFLTLYAVLRIVLPSQYVIGPLGGAGQPAQLIGLGIAILWVADWLGQPWSRFPVRQPLKRSAFVFLIAVLASYLVAALRPLNSAEQLAADRSVLNFIAWIGVMLTAMDGVLTRDRLDTLLRRVVLLGALEGGLGVLQLLARQSFLQYFDLPGLANTGVDPLLLTRGSFLRPVGTAISPIEYGIFLSMVLPIALHYAVSDAGRRGFLARWIPVGAIACALALSLSRSAIVSTVVGLALLVVTWPPALRRRVYVIAVAFIAVMAFALRGFLGTILSLFGGIGSDSSTVSRLDSYSVAWSFIARSPLLGRGAGTFLPEYWILDDQFLGSLIEIGVVGLACMILLFWNGGITAWRLRRPTLLPGGYVGPASPLGPALAAAIAAGCASFFFFDAFSFPMVPSMLFLLFGCVGALRRLTLEDAYKGAGVIPGVAASGRPRARLGPGESWGVTVWRLAYVVRRRWPLVVVGVFASFVGATIAAAAPGVYFEQMNVVMTAPNGTGFQPGAGGLVSTAGVLESQLGEAGPLKLSPAATIVGAGIRDGVWVRLPNNGGQWATNFDEEDLDVEVVDGSPSQVQADMNATLSRIRTLLRQDQLSVGVQPAHLIGIGLSPLSPPVSYEKGSSSRAGITAFVLGLVLTLTVTVMADEWLTRRRSRILAERMGGSAPVGSSAP
jgi:O-antigen ligase